MAGRDDSFARQSDGSLPGNVDSLLSRTPYGFPDDCDPTQEIVKLKEIEDALRGRLANIVATLYAMGFYAEVQSQTRVKEVYETNAIENVGPTLRRTIQILQSDYAQRAEEAVKHGMFMTSISREPDILSVIGVYGAREFSRTLLSSDSSRPLSEVDIRSIHALVASGEWYAGAYRTRVVEIRGAVHKPPHPIEVPDKMRELVEWQNDSAGSIPPLLRAGVAHAWLTHVHPFVDGNGRVARLLVNMIMMRSGLPPVILRNSADKGPYLDALGHSDAGGDVLPFTFVLANAMNRTMREIEKPQFLRGIFRAEMRERGDSLFDHWASTIDKFVEDLTYHLELYRLHVERVGTVDRASFELLKDADSGGNSWFLRIKNSDDREILIWVGYSSPNASRFIVGKYRLPSLRLSIRDLVSRVQPYRLIDRMRIEGLSETVVEPDVEARVYMSFERMEILSLSAGAERLAGVISRAFSTNVPPPVRHQSY